MVHRRKRGRTGRRSGLVKARCVREQMAEGKTKTDARKMCGVSGKGRRRKY